MEAKKSETEVEVVRLDARTRYELAETVTQWVVNRMTDRLLTVVTWAAIFLGVFSLGRLWAELRDEP